MSKFERAVFGVLELAEDGVISFSRAAEVLGVKIMPLRELACKKPKDFDTRRNYAMERLAKKIIKGGKK